MVMTFRVSELQLLLGLSNQSRCGRKTELMQRALLLVERGVSPQVNLKIRELYQKYTQRLGAGYTSSLMQKVVANGAPGLSGGSDSSYHVAGLSLSTSRIEVRLKQLPFYDILEEVMHPTQLATRQGKLQETRVNFVITENQIRTVTASRDNLIMDRVEYVNQLQLRFCLINTATRQPDCFPNSLIVKVNGLAAALPNLIPTNKPGAEPKRPNRPVDITKLCRLHHMCENFISMTWNAEEGKNYCVSIHLVKKLNSTILLQRLRRSGMSKPEFTKNLIKEKLSLDCDAELATTSLRASLLCPLGKMRMTLPCRSSNCNHVQCFDAVTFLQMNEKKPTWMCPVCDRPADFNKLVLDGLFIEILRGTTDSTEVELMRNGSWCVTRVDDVDDSEDDHSQTNRKSPEHESGQDSGGAVIDLTETDEEDNAMATSAPPPPRHPAPSATPHSSRSTPKSQATNNSLAGSPPIAIYDLSPVRMPVNTPPTPCSPLQPPKAHQNHASTFTRYPSPLANFQAVPTGLFPPIGPEDLVALMSGTIPPEFSGIMAGRAGYPPFLGDQMIDYLYRHSIATRGDAKSSPSLD